MRMQIDDAILDVLDEGRGGPAMLLIHPFPLSKEVWDGVAAALAARARIVRLDLRGLGNSSAPPGPYLMESLAGDVAGVLDALGIERVALVGNSLGVMVAFAFYRMFAERVSALGLVGGHGAADDAETARKRNELAASVERAGTEPLVARYLERLFAPDVYRERPELVARARAQIERTDPRGAAAVLRGMAMRDSAADLYPEFRIPVRVIAGARDAFVPPDVMRSMAHAIRGARFDVLECGHVPALEAPLALAALLEPLLDASG